MRYSRAAHTTLAQISRESNDTAGQKMGLGGNVNIQQPVVIAISSIRREVLIYEI
jgi:hypothetical protein